MSLNQDKAITGRAIELLKAIEKANDWMSRAQIARATDKRQLSPHDANLLQRLVDAGLIEIRQRENNTPVGIAFDYRAKVKE